MLYAYWIANRFFDDLVLWLVYNCIWKIDFGKVSIAFWDAREHWSYPSPFCMHVAYDVSYSMSAFCVDIQLKIYFITLPSVLILRCKHREVHLKGDFMRWIIISSFESFFFHLWFPRNMYQDEMKHIGFLNVDVISV